ncbi:MAG TPA: FMN-binding protein [Caproiciproducens sp.]|nr:FMN-binding protein [Caproiciproducens sp.]
MSNTKHKFPILQAVRLLLQILFFLFIPALYIGALNGIKEIYQAILHQSFSTALVPQLVEAAVIIPVTVLFGRFFCGWMCAFGSFGEFIYMIFHKVFPKKVRISERTDRLLKSVKYIILAVLVIAVWSFELPLFSTASPWDAFGMLATVGKAPDFSYVTTSLTAGFILLLGIIAGSAVIERFFCRYLCPLGAIFSIVSRPRIAKIKKPSAQCGNCRACTNKCAMGIPLYKMDKVSTGECIHCMKCVTVCPRGNADFTVARSDVRPLLAGTAAAAAMAGMYCSAEFALNLTGTKTTAAAAETGNTSRVYRDGTYEGSGTGFHGGTTTVSVTIKNDKITDISTVSYQDNDPFYNKAYPAVTSEIIGSQSPEVDTVSGATFSSNGIMNAVADALSKAKVSSVESAVSSALSLPESEAAQAETPDTQENQNTEQAASSSSAAPSANGSYKDGTYSGTGNGFRGATTVSVVVAGGKITEVSVESYQDDDRFFNRAYSEVTQEIISSQSAEVDAVSGATFSSNGIMSAVADALKSAAKA